MEDSDGEMIGVQFQNKFLDIMQAIRANDPKLKATEGEYFKDDDFVMPDLEGHSVKKPFTLKD
jgi:hypothetical protein